MNLLMLDTDVSSYIIRKRPASLLARFEAHPERLCVSVITAAELRFGAEKVQRRELTSLVESFLERLAILDWSAAATHHYARIRAALEKSGTPIGNLDLLIAAHAVTERATLVTNNIRHFAHVPSLKLDTWS